ncbi:hypothetical protein GA0070624_4996 [Micromonospora rhizosphaerae]|uniref:Uncharacterized protein n=1 Tax=Micromonospora rhizosphaerae TaxID=568872 RepID=A0A1C6SZB8_9ACTN|nr:hypothetical protein [Micromonospora rhizosphaerae]SCL34465.1 hypothetical protein GA0070624_4996 [Micromonospora rhizosphaerae]
MDLPARLEIQGEVGVVIRQGRSRRPSLAVREGSGGAVPLTDKDRGIKWSPRNEPGPVGH